MTTEPDPLYDLARALHAGRPPPLPWVVRADLAGRDPVADAWAASHDAWAMLAVLRCVGLERWRPAWDAYSTRPAGAGTWSAVAAIRAAVPPPTLPEVLAAVERGRVRG